VSDPAWLSTYLAAAAATLLLVLALALPGRAPWAVLAGALAGLARRRGGRLLLLVAALVFGTNLLEATWDAELSAWLGYDLTPAVFALEGDLVARAQRWTVPGASALLTWVYAPAFPALLAAPPMIWWDQRRVRPTAEYMLAIAANYVFALPFYLLVPVREVAWSGLGTAVPRMEEVVPGFTPFLRSASALDNCLPSLHVSCTVTVAWFAWRHGPPAFRRLALAGAALTAWATIALGVHWLTDVATGVLFGGACSLFAVRTAPRLAPRWLVLEPPVSPG